MTLFTWPWPSIGHFWGCIHILTDFFKLTLTMKSLKKPTSPGEENYLWKAKDYRMWSACLPRSQSQGEVKLGFEPDLLAVNGLLGLGQLSSSFASLVLGVACLTSGSLNMLCSPARITLSSPSPMSRAFFCYLKGVQAHNRGERNICGMDKWVDVFL